MLFDRGGFFLLQIMADQQGPQQTDGEHPHQSLHAFGVFQPRSFQIETFGFEKTESRFNGLITNDKFCLSRHHRLQLSWSRCPLRLR